MASSAPAFVAPVNRRSRLGSRALARTEQSIDAQLGLRDLHAACQAAIVELSREKSRDELTDRQRVTKYKAVADAIRAGDPTVAMAALVNLAGFEYGDEYLEDAHRDGAIVAGEKLDQALGDLHATLYDLTPELVEGIPVSLIVRQRKAARA